MLRSTCNTSAYMVFHAEGLTEIDVAQVIVEALRTAVITFLLPNLPYPLSMNLPPMLPPLLTTATSVSLALRT